MAYDRDDSRRGPREQARHSDERYRDPRRERSDRSEREERGFLERAGDQIASWFGEEDDDERSRRRDQPMRGREPWGAGDREDRGYRPVTGDYGRSEGRFAASGTPRGDSGPGRRDRESVWGRDEYRRTSPAGSEGRSQFDPHYAQWRQRQIEELDRDYDEYRREHQSKFENDFGGWRERRQSKRQMLGQIREHMEVVGSDEQHVGKVDRVAGDRIILAKSDPEAGGVHHSLSCTEIGRIDGDKVILELPAEQARGRWRDESRERALFEREDQGEAGPHSLERSFPGTYR